MYFQIQILEDELKIVIVILVAKYW